MATGLVLVDNTVLTNYALIARPDLVTDLRGVEFATTPEVMAEYQAGVTGRGMPVAVWDSLPQLTLNPAEPRFADRLLPRLGRGERSCLAVAVHRQGAIACDDAVARREAQRLGLIVTGTIGILVVNIRQTRLTIADGNAILAGLIALGYRSPLADLSDLI